MAGFTLSEFHTLVSDEIGRGSELATAITLRTKLAAAWLERHYTFQYMRDWRTLAVSSSATYPHIVSLAGLQVKRLELIRRREADDAGTGYKFGRPLKQLGPEDRETRSTGEPRSYWLNGVSSLVFDTIPDEDMTFEAHFQLLSTWGTDSTWTHWLLDNATNLLRARTLMMMMGRTRNPNMYQMYKEEFDLELDALKTYEEELQTGEVITLWEPPEYLGSDDSLRGQ